jgi:MFS family permease
MNLSRPYPLLALRSLILLPGALVEGVLAVALPWLVTKTNLGTAWLGALSALLVAAAIAGTLIAPLATKRFGSRRVVLVGALVQAGSLGIAAVFWLLGYTALAFGAAWVAIAADGMADIAFSARSPVLSRLVRQPLAQFTSANWLWSVGGLAMGSAIAGIAIDEGTADTNSIAWLAAMTAALSLLVALGLAALMPRDGRRVLAKYNVQVTGLKHQKLWNQRTVLLIALIAGMSFLYGPIDNLLAPAHVASNGRGPSTFAALMTAGGIGLAAGLLLTQTLQTGRYGAALVFAGLGGIFVQLILLWWLPSHLWLVLGGFLTAATIAPLLPLLESVGLHAVSAAERTALMAAIGAAASLADFAGTMVLGALAGVVGTTNAIAVAVILAGLGFTASVPIARRVIPPRKVVSSSD